MKTYKSINSALKEPEKVQSLFLTEQRFDKFPEEIFKLTNLEELTFELCKLKTISPDIVKLPLKTFELFACWITTIPAEVFLIPTLEQGSFVETKTKNIKEKQALIQYITSKKPSLQLREAMVAFLYNDQSKIDACTIEQLTGVLNAPIAPMQLAVKKEIEKRSGTSFKNNPPAAKSRVVLLGKLRSGYNVLANRLKSIDIEAGKKIKGDTNYVVLGEKPGEISLSEKRLLVITENQLLSFLNDHTPQELKDTNNDEVPKNLLELLQSKEQTNYTIAFELINRHGLPGVAITDLFALWISSYDKAFRDMAKTH